MPQPADPLSRLDFTTDKLAERDRFPVYCEEMIRRYAALDVVKLGEQQFRGAIRFDRAKEIAIGAIATTPTDYVRTPGFVRDGNDALVVVFCRRGTAIATQSIGEQRLMAGQAVVCDNTQTGALHVPTPSQFWSLRVPRHRIAALLPGIDRLAGARLDRDEMARRLLFGYLEATHAIELTGSPRAIELLDQHVTDLVALALGAGAEAREIVERRTGRGARLSAIKADIAANMQNSDLSVRDIARRHLISPSYVRKLFGMEGTSFTAFVLEQRLARAHRMLADKRYAGRTISAIAFQVGFSDLSYFNRTFRRRYQATPSDVRAAAPRE